MLGNEDNRRTISVQVSLRGQTEGQAAPAARAYLFDRAGRLVESKPIRDDSAKFHVAASQAYRVTVGPELLTEGKAAPANLEGQLAKANALSQDFLPAGPASAEFKIYPNIWFCWFPTCINVHGTVTNGTYPLCYGTVQIFQVDLGCTLDSFTVIDFLSFKSKLVDELTASRAAAGQAPGKRLVSLATAPRANLAASASSKTAAIASAPARAASLSLGDLGATLSVLDRVSATQFIIANKYILFPF